MSHSTRTDILTRWLDPALVGLVGLLYLYRLYPHLWWGDEPELLTATFCNGVAHPTGYPLYLLLQKTFFFLPLGSVAWKGHLFSAVVVLLGMGFLLRVIPLKLGLDSMTDSISPHPNPPLHTESWWRALGWRMGILILSLAPLLRKQGMVAEVYGLSFFFVALLVLLATRFTTKPNPRLLLGLALTAGLGFGHHRLMGFMLPGLALLLVAPLRDSGIRIRSILLAGLAFFLAVFLPYTLLWLHARGNPPLNWDAPSSLENLWRVFSASQFRFDQKIVRAQEWMSYQAGMGPHPWLISLNDLQLLPGLWWDNLGFSLPLCGLGMWGLWRRAPRVLIAGCVAWLLPTLFVAQYHVADRETFHLSAVVLVGLALAEGWAFLLEWTAMRHHLLPLLFPPLVGLLLMHQSSQLEILPKGLSTLPEQYANRCLDEVPPGGILLAVSVTPNAPVDYTYFPLLYEKEVAKRGQRIALISEGFFTTPWYRGTLHREGIPTSLFDALQQGIPDVPLIQTDMAALLGKEMPRIQTLAQGREPTLAVFEVDGRYFLANRYTQGALMAKTLLPALSHRPLFFTSRMTEVEPYLKDRIEWKEVFRIPMLTQGYGDLDGMPIPSGKLFQASLFSPLPPSLNLK